MIRDERLARTKKVFRVNGALIGIAGDLSHLTMFVHWYDSGADLGDRPKDFGGLALVLDASGIYLYGGECYPAPILDEYHAIGSGAQVALTAMRLGKSPKEAVELACELDVYTGPPVVVEKLKEE